LRIDKIAEKTVAVCVAALIQQIKQPGPGPADKD